MAWIHVQLSSEEIRMPSSIEVMLPQTAVEKLAVGEKLPVLYLLHDRTGDHSQWLRKTALEVYQEEVPIAIVMPSGNASYFVNMKYGKSYQNYIRNELPSLCERLFPVSDKREEKYLAGAGMGGYGALNIALTEDCPFGTIGAFQADIDIKKFYDTEPEKMEKIFGSLSEYEQSQNCLMYVAEHLSEKVCTIKLPKIMMMCSNNEDIQKENEALFSILRKYTENIELKKSEMTSGWGYYGDCLYSFMKEAYNRR